MKPFKLIPRLIKIIQMLLAAAILAGAAPLLGVSVPAKAAELCASLYTVQPGETLQSIALQFHVTVEELAAANQMKASDAIAAGESLCIPYAASLASDLPPAPLNCRLAARVQYHRRVEIRGSRFPRQHAFNVKVRPYGYGWGGWVKIGAVRARSDGTVRGDWRLPETMRRYPRIQVCLKEVDRGYLVCAIAKNY